MVVILAILAAAVIPQFSDSTVDAKSSVMLNNLNVFRMRISVYQVEHGGQFPDATIVAELTSKTNSDGTTSGTPSLGPYFFAVPANPLVIDPTVQSLVQVVSSDPTQNITTHGWIYNSTNGKIFSATDITK